MVHQMNIMYKWANSFNGMTVDEFLHNYEEVDITKETTSDESDTELANLKYNTCDDGKKIEDISGNTALIILGKEPYRVVPVIGPCSGEFVIYACKGKSFLTLTSKKEGEYEKNTRNQKKIMQWVCNIR